MQRRLERTHRISVPGNPHGGAITPDGSFIYTASMGHMAFRPDGKELYVTNDADDMVSVIDVGSNRPVASFPVGQGPHGVASSADGRYVIVANRGGTTLSVIDARSREIVATREVGQRPEHVTTGPDGRVLLVSVNTGSNKILMIDPASFETLAEIDVWAAPHAFLIARSARLQ